MKNSRCGFTLVELIIVVIIIGILASIAIPAYMHTQERAFDSDAKASVKLIQAAERIYRLESGFYYPPSGSVSVNSTINTNLKLSLPVTTPKWTYTANSTGNASALRTSGSHIRTWTLLIANDNATCSPPANCP